MSIGSVSLSVGLVVGGTAVASKGIKLCCRGEKSNKWVGVALVASGALAIIGGVYSLISMRQQRQTCPTYPEAEAPCINTLAGGAIINHNRRAIPLAPLQENQDFEMVRCNRMGTCLEKAHNCEVILTETGREKVREAGIYGDIMRVFFKVPDDGERIAWMSGNDWYWW